MDAADLYTQHAPALRRYLASRVAADDVDDLLSDTFERVLRALPSYEERGWPVTAWLYRIAHARLVDFRRAEQRRPHVSIERWHAVIDGPEQTVEQRDMQAWARRQILAHLDGRQRQVIWLRFIEDLSLPETAHRLGLSVEHVKSFQFRGIARLRIALAGGDDSPITIALAEAREPQFRSCQVDGCARPVAGRGYCWSHYLRWRRRGTAEAMPTICTADGCERRVKARALCERHYRRLLYAEKKQARRDLDTRE